MRRLMVLLAVSATALFAAISAGAVTNNWDLTLTVPDTVHLGNPVLLTGTMVQQGNLAPADNGDVTINVYGGWDCSTDPLTGWDVVTDGNGNFSYGEPAWNDDNYPAFSFMAVPGWGDKGASECVTMMVAENVAPPIPAPTVVPRVDSVFLCYSAFQDQPGVWPLADAKTLFASGYWMPFAVKGNVTGGTNVGDYHLTCNVAAGQSATKASVGAGGHVYGPELSGMLGAYPIVG